MRAWWAGRAGVAGTALSVATAPLEGAFRAAVALRERGYRRGILSSHRAPVPVISVGNLTVGGTGKTPVTSWVVEVLLEAGRRPAVVARGYGDDELRLHRRWHPGVAVHADPDRVRAARDAATAGADVIVLDDGFQHRRLARDLDVVLLAAEQPFPGRMLPRGPFREPPAALRRADVVVLTRRTAEPEAVDALEVAAAAAAPGPARARARLVPRAWRALDGGAADPPSGDVLAVSAVAGPEAFRRMVARGGAARVEALSFPDHHAYGPADVEAIVRRAGGRPVAVTEKDAVKLEAWADRLGDVRVLALAVEVEAGEAELRDALARAVAP